MIYYVPVFKSSRESRINKYLTFKDGRYFLFFILINQWEIWAIMSKLIYIIDDEKEVSELLRLTLETRNYRVKTGNDGEKCLALIKQKKPDLLILDLKMPKMNGYEVINALKSSKEYADIPIMVLTIITQGSTKTDEDWKRSLEVQEFVTKPFDPLEILKKVKNILEQDKS
jgi:response regulator RpfG family c-di-GMP phosphodiesterase